MKKDGTPETEFEEAMPLFGAIMSQMSADRTWTENQIQGIMERRVRELQEDYIQLYNALRKVYDRTDSGTARDALERFYHINDDCVRELGKGEESY